MTPSENATVDRGESTCREGTGRPPVLDIGLLLRAFVKALPLALVIGAVVGVVTGLILSSIRPTYATTTTVTVGTPSRAQQDADTLEALGAGMSEFVTDERVRYFVYERTGEEVSVNGLFPSLEASTTKIPGVVEIITRTKTGPLAATAMGSAVVDGMNLRANEVRDEFLGTVDEATQEQIDDLNEQIAARRRIDPRADTSDLLSLIYDARTRAETLKVGYSSASIVSQDDAEGAPVWPKPVASGLLVALVVTLLGAVVLAALRIRRSRRADALWARAMGHRHDSVVDVDNAPENGLPLRTEAAVAAVVSRGGKVVLLGDVDPGDLAGEKVHVAEYADPWWREIEVSEVGLGVVVVDHGAASPRAAESGLAGLDEVGVPTRLVIRRSGDGE